MPVTYRFDSNIVVIEMAGEYSMDDIRSTILNALADSQCLANSFLMINLGESQSIFNRPPEDVKIISQFVASLGKRFHNRLALVASADFPYGLMRMTSVGSEERGIESEVFRTFAEARKWLLS